MFKAAQPPDKTKLLELFARFNFKTWRRELEQGELPVARDDDALGISSELPATATEKIPRVYETVLTDAARTEWIAKMRAAPLVCVDTETTGLDPMTSKIVGISISVEPHRAAYIPLAHNYPGAPTQLDFDATLAKLKPIPTVVRWSGNAAVKTGAWF